MSSITTQKSAAAAVAKPAKNKSSVTSNSKVAADTARYEALAREHGADLSEEGFNAVLKKVAAPK